tara:strand:- start:1510 stop:2190 length:681 start_codon:yes stop_codon:yes gene_type:complete
MSHEESFGDDFHYHTKGVRSPKLGFGLCGAQRTGKTTLAKAVSEETGMFYLETSASGTFRRLGKDPKAEYPFAERLEIQREILKDMVALYEEAPKGFVTDRTPVDICAYTIGDMMRGNYSDSPALMSFRNECLATLEKYFRTVCVVQPGIAITEDFNKAQGNPAHMEHINTICIGLLSSDELSVSAKVMARDVITLEERLETVNICLISDADISAAKIFQETRRVC